MDISHSVSTDGSDTSSPATRPVSVDEIPGPANDTSFSAKSVKILKYTTFLQPPQNALLIKAGTFVKC